MQKLLQKAVASLQNTKKAEVAANVNTTVISPELEYYNQEDPEECDCEAIMTFLTNTEFETLTLTGECYDEIEYLCDDERLFDYVTAILEDLNVPDEEIDNYICGITLDDSFLDFDEQIGGDILVSVNTHALYEFLIDIQTAY